MSNVLGDDKQHQVVALGRLGWSLRRIEPATGVRRETASGYLKAVGIVVRGRDRPSESKPKPAISPRCPPTSGGQNRPPGGSCPPTSLWSLSRVARPVRARASHIES